MKSRNKVDTIKGVDEHETYDKTSGQFVVFKSKQWEMLGKNFKTIKKN